MEIPERGESLEDILFRLQSYKEADLPWRAGRVWAYTYEPGGADQRAAEEAYALYLGENALDPTTFPSTLRIETEVVRMVAGLLQGGDSAAGNCTSGGTESILCAMKTARDWARVHKPHVTAPEIVFPETAHAAFYKAAHYLGLKPVAAPFDPLTFRADVPAMAKAITDNTILLAASAPSYAQGVVDPIPEIAALARDRGLLCHVDACVGGIYLSIMRRAGESVPPFDFSVPGVTSISADMHKYGFAPKNVSCILYRDRALRAFQLFTCMRTTTYALVNPTVLSARSGGPLAGAWAALHHLGEEGYRRLIRETMEATERMVAGIDAIEGLRVLGRPDMCLFSFAAVGFNIFELADALRDRGWFAQPQFSTALSPANLHVTVNPAGAANAEAFLADLRDAVDAVRNGPEPIDAAAVRDTVAGLLRENPSEAIAQLAAMANVTPGAAPERMALVNTILDALPRDMGEALLGGFANALYP